jgi:hypothetical protein
MSKKAVQERLYELPCSENGKPATWDGVNPVAHSGDPSGNAGGGVRVIPECNGRLYYSLVGLLSSDDVTCRAQAVDDITTATPRVGRVRTDLQLHLLAERRCLWPERSKTGDGVIPRSFRSLEMASGPKDVECAAGLRTGMAVGDPRLKAGVTDEL